MIETSLEIIDYTEEYLVRGVFISILVIALVKRFLNKNIKTDLSIQFIRWMLIFYGFLSLGDLILNGYKEPHLEGSYFWLVTLFFNVVFPLLLFNNRLVKKLTVVFTISVLVNFGWLFESFIIHATTIHRDYITDGLIDFLPNCREQIIILRGVALGIILIVIENLIIKSRRI